MQNSTPTHPNDSIAPASPTADRAADIDWSDWEFAFLRSEMLRQFKSELMGNLGHELRSPLSSQMGALDLILSGLCDSMEEIQEFATTARQSAQKHLQLIGDCIELSRYESPVRSLNLETASISSPLEQVGILIAPIAQDRGIRFEWIKSNSLVWTDVHGLEQALLGGLMWGVLRMVHGSVILHESRGVERLELTLTLSGQLRESAGDRNSLYWQVAQSLMSAMGGKLQVMDSSDVQLVIAWSIPTEKASVVADAIAP